MTADSIGPAPLAAAGSDSSGTPPNGDAAAFEQALRDALPAVAVNVLMPVIMDSLGEMQSMADDAEGS